MKTPNMLFSLVEVFLIILILGLGVFFVSCPQAPNFCAYVAHVFLYKTELIFNVGIVFILLSFFMLISFYSFNRGKILKVKIKEGSCVVNTVIVEEYVKQYLFDNYPDAKFTTEIFVDYKKRIDIILQKLASIDEEETFFLEKMKKYLQNLLHEKFNYKSDFFITIYKKN